MTRELWVRGAQPVDNINEAAISSSVARALQRWLAATGNDGGVLIGDIALAFYSRPRFVDQIDFLYLDEASVPENVPGFKKRSPNEFVDTRTKTVVYAHFPGENWLPPELIEKVHHTAVSKGGIMLPSLHGMVALKLHRGLYDRVGGRRDQQDVVDMISWSDDFELQHMEWWDLDEAHFELLLELHEIARSKTEVT